MHMQHATYTCTCNMQEWKKRWSDSGGNIDPAARFDSFRLSQDGLHALSV